MGRPPKEINVKRCERLKELLCDVKKKDSVHNSQSEIAKRILISQQVLSQIIHKKQNLTEDVAERIISLFSEYRIEWLLGYDDFKTHPDEADYYMNKQLNEWQQEDKLHTAMMYIIHSLGYDVALDANCFCIIDNEKEECAVLPLSAAKEYHDELLHIIESFVHFHFGKQKKERIKPNS